MKRELIMRKKKMILCGIRLRCGANRIVHNQRNIHIYVRNPTAMWRESDSPRNRLSIILLRPVASVREPGPTAMCANRLVRERAIETNPPAAGCECTRAGADCDVRESVSTRKGN